MRLWANLLRDNPDKKENMTKKDKWLVFISALADASIIGLLVYTLMANSCAICYQTGFGQDTFTQCKGYSDIMETGLPQEVLDIYEPSLEKKSVGYEPALSIENIEVFQPEIESLG